MSRLARLGAFIIFTFAVLAAGVFVIGSKAYLFRSTYQLKAKFADVAGLDAGADVRVGGVHSGTVHSIELPHRPGEEVTVVMEMDRSTHEIIKRDSAASIETEGLLGSQYLAISFGSAGQPDVRDGDSIQSKPPLEMADLLIKANALLSTTQKAVQSASEASANLSSVTAKIDAGKGTVGALINDKTLYVNLTKSSDDLQATMSEAQGGVASFKDNMDAMKHNFLLRGYFNRRGYQDSSDLVENEIAQLPVSSPVKTFTYTPKDLFDNKDSVKLHHQQSLNDSGEFLAKNQFGLAVIVVSSGMEGDSQKNMVLTQVRAMLVREYLVQHFGFDDSQLKTHAVGKQVSDTSGAGQGSIQIFIYPVGNTVPPNQVTVGGARQK